MEKRIFGIILTILGIIGLIMGAMEFTKGVNNNVELRTTIVYSVLGAVFFFSGIGLIRSTRELKKRDEEIV